VILDQPIMDELPALLAGDEARPSLALALSSGGAGLAGGLDFRVVARPREYDP